MKRMLCLAGSLMLLVLCACARPLSPASEPMPTADVAGDSYEAAMYLKVAKLYESSFLGVGMGDRATAGELYFVPTTGVTFTEGKTLAPGMLVTVFYDGTVQETYPMTIANPGCIAWAENRGDTVGFYYDVLMELYGQDPALNDGINALGFDLSETANLSEAEKAALIYLLSSELGLEPVAGTCEELCEQGYIDNDELFFPKGVLLKIAVTDEGEGKFTFSVSKWRGGLGAIGINGCTAKYAGGAWSYTPGEMWIS